MIEAFKGVRSAPVPVHLCVQGCRLIKGRLGISHMNQSASACFHWQLPRLRCPGGTFGLLVGESHCYLISNALGVWWKYRSSDTAACMITKERILFILTCFNTWLLFFPPSVSYTCLHHQQWFTEVNWQPVSLGFTPLSSPARWLWLNPYMTINTE